jgi:hypothetical protein
MNLAHNRLIYRILCYLILKYFTNHAIGFYDSKSLVKYKNNFNIPNGYRINDHLINREMVYLYSELIMNKLCQFICVVTYLKHFTQQQISLAINKNTKSFFLKKIPLPMKRFPLEGFFTI